MDNWNIADFFRSYRIALILYHQYKPLVSINITLPFEKRFGLQFCEFGPKAHFSCKL